MNPLTQGTVEQLEKAGFVALYDQVGRLSCYRREDFPLPNLCVSVYSSDYGVQGHLCSSVFHEEDVNVFTEELEEGPSFVNRMKDGLRARIQSHVQWIDTRIAELEDEITTHNEVLAALEEH